MPMRMRPAWRHEAAAVADGVARLQLLHADQPRAQRHRRLQAPVRDVVRREIGRAAIAHDAGAHPVGAAAAAAPRGAAWRRCWTSVRSPGRSCVAASKAASWRAMPRAPSASAKCVISEISSTCGSAFSRAQALRKASGVKPRRFMPLFIFRNTRCGWCVLCAASQSICSSRCTTCHRFRREHSSRSRGSKHAFEQQDRAAPAERAHALGLGQVEQRKAVGAAQAVEDALDAVAVGVGLDHRPDPRVGRGGAGARQVVGQRVGVDQGFDRAGHGRGDRSAGARLGRTGSWIAPGPRAITRRPRRRETPQNQAQPAPAPAARATR